MAVIQEEGVGQELYTRDHGTVKVDKMTFQDGGFHIVRSPNGAYMHANGLPVRDEKELRAAIPKGEFLDEALEWFRNRHMHDEHKPRAIGFRADNTPVFDDGSIPNFDDLYAFFKPGPILTAAIVALQEHINKEAGVVAPPRHQAKGAHAAPPAKGGGKGGKNKSKKSGDKAKKESGAPAQAGEAPQVTA